jgi:hypothetical protein
MIDSNRVYQLGRELERYQRDYSRAKNTIESTKRELAEFVLVNAAVIAEGQAVDLSAYEESITEAEWDMCYAAKTFEETKSQLAAMVNRGVLYE